ncbi:hypothetical protein WJX84_004112 [Apatococcus fuscideae]|uniref:Protein kinase domain-containing protein n=1 Tax=Apatococcus fuscideae TaxID=2026836 RepID=A0AAW1S815_9CHLO
MGGLQASLFLQDAAGLNNRTDQDSSVNTVFEILTEPAADAGFTYTWRPLSDIVNDDFLNLPSDQSLFQINGSTPCCILISDRMKEEINRTQENLARDGKFWILTSSPISGQLMGMCTGIPEQNGTVAPSAIFAYYGRIYAATEAEIQDPSTSPMALVVQSHSGKDVASAAASGLGTELQADSGAVPNRFQQVKADAKPVSDPPFTSSGGGIVWESVNETVTDFPASPEVPPWDCKMSPDVVSPAGYIDQYVPPDLRTHVAIIQTSKLIGRPQPGSTQWTLGRASRVHDAKTGRSTSLFLGANAQGFERNASLLSSPPEFFVLTNANSGPGAQYKFEYRWAPKDAIGKGIPMSSHVFDINGLTPCCVNTSTHGSIMGTCSMKQNQAFYTWDQLQQSTSIDQADLLYIIPAGTNYAGAIAGGVIGGVILLGLLGYLIIVGLWSLCSYRFRARKRLIEDQAGVDIDRFYNLLPFHSRMPRNQFFAELASKVAHMTLAGWTSNLGTGPRSSTAGVFDARFEGKEPEALAFAIMKHDTVWGSTSRAIVQLLRRGHKGRKQLGQMVEGVLISPEIDDFLDGLDTRPAQMHSIFHEGVWRATTRLFCLALPSQHTRVDDAIADCEEAAPLSKAGYDNAQTPNFMLGGAEGDVDSLTAEKQAQRHAAAMSQVIAELQLDDWAVKEREIEIMCNADGSLCELGHGAFGQVFKAKWNGVQVVAVKQLRAISDDKAQLSFLREVAVLKRVRAENIVRFLGICITTDKTMLVTELMEGGDLWTALNNAARKEELSWYRKGERIAGDMARGVAFLHSQQIVHFDIKSPNILLARDYTAKLADVGLARFMHKQHFTAITNVGTLQWAAPEILAGKVEKITMKCDVYSLGVVMWEVVTAESPRFGQAWYRAPRVPDECPQWVADLITECMRSNPDRRPTSKENVNSSKSFGKTGYDALELCLAMSTTVGQQKGSHTLIFGPLLFEVSAAPR